MKRVLILGGGTMQLPAVRAARELGWFVACADGNAACPAAGQVDRFLHIDIKDHDLLLNAARSLRNEGGLDGVFTAGTDFSTSVAHITDALGLPGHSYQAALNATDKSRMRNALRAAGIAVPPYAEVSDMDGPVELERIAEAVGYPLVVKPVDNMGARGVRRVDRFSELLDAVSHALRLSRSSRAVIEGFIVGPEFSVDALVYDGRVEITGCADRHIYYPPYFVELGHTIPSAVSDFDLKLLTAAFVDAVRALGLTHGAAKGDIFLSEGRAVVGEVAARLSGGYMSGWTYPASSGVDLTRIALRLAVGVRPTDADLAPTRRHTTVERAQVAAPGIVESVSCDNARLAHADAWFVRVQPGDRVAPPTNNVEKVANVIVARATREDAVQEAERLLDAFQIRLQPNNPDTEEFLFGSGWRSDHAQYRAERGAVESLPAWTGETPPKPVRDAVPYRARTLKLRALRPAPDAGWLLERLHAEGLIRAVASQDTAFGLDGLFWRAFSAAGRQGVLYLLDSLRSHTDADAIRVMLQRWTAR